MIIRIYIVQFCFTAEWSCFDVNLQFLTISIFYYYSDSYNNLLTRVGRWGYIVKYKAPCVLLCKQYQAMVFLRFKIWIEKQLQNKRWNKNECENCKYFLLYPQQTSKQEKWCSDHKVSQYRLVITFSSDLSNQLSV